jgi:hypothetical protein
MGMRAAWSRFASYISPKLMKHMPKSFCSMILTNGDGIRTSGGALDEPASQAAANVLCFPELNVSTWLAWQPPRWET